MIETNSKNRQGSSLWSQLYIAVSYIVLLSKDSLGDGCGTETFKAVAINNKTCILHVCVMLFHTLIHMGLKLKNISKKIDTVFLINYEDIISSKMGAGVFLP